RDRGSLGGRSGIYDPAVANHERPIGHGRRAAAVDQLAATNEHGSLSRFHRRIFPVQFWLVRGSPGILAEATLKGCQKTAGDCPDFAQSSEQNGTVPLSEEVFCQPFTRIRPI